MERPSGRPSLRHAPIYTMWTTEPLGCIGDTGLPERPLPQISVFGVSLELLIRSADQQFQTAVSGQARGSIPSRYPEAACQLIGPAPGGREETPRHVLTNSESFPGGVKSEVALLLVLRLSSEELSLTPELPGAEYKLVAS